MQKQLIAILGWYGVVAIVGAYALVSDNIMSPTSVTYQLLNLTGAIGIIVESVAKRDKQPAVLNIFWALIALAGIIKTIT